MGVDPRRLKEFQDELAAVFDLRSAALGLSGIPRDEHATTFWAGAAHALRILGGHDDIAEAVAKHGVVEIAVRGGLDLNHGLTKASYVRLGAPWDRS